MTLTALTTLMTFIFIFLYIVSALCPITYLQSYPAVKYCAEFSVNPITGPISLPRFPMILRWPPILKWDGALAPSPLDEPIKTATTLL